MARPHVMVCGGRDYTDFDHLAKVLDALDPAKVIHGGARGADSMAGEWARREIAAGSDVELAVFEADFETHGPFAGPMRNTEMLRKGKPNLVVAFAGGRGTHDMTSKAKRAGVPVLEVMPR